MSQDKRNIDQLFRAKLRDYEVTPSPSAWENIVSKLSAQKKISKIIILRRAGVAAAVAALIFAGWWVIKPDDLNETNQNAANITATPKTETVNPVYSSPPHTESAQLAVHDKKVSVNLAAGITINRGREFKPSLNTLASFAPGTTLLNKSNEQIEESAKESGLVDIEKEFLSHYRNDMKIIRQLSDRLTSVNNSSKFEDTVPKRTLSSEGFRQLNSNMITQANRTSTENKNPYFAGELKKESSNNRKGNWIVGAGLSPVTITQRDGGSSVSGQQTSYENTVSGSMMAGYKITRKFTIKTGVILNQLRQVTRISDYPPAYSSDAMTFKTANIATTSGSVNLDRAILIKSDVLFSSEVIPTPGGRPELKQDFRYIEIPVEMVYKLIDRKFNIGLTGGVSTNILAGNRAGLYEDGQKINNGRTSNLRDITYSGAIGLEFGYDLNNKVTITVEPHLKRFLNSVSSNQEIDFKPYQVDIMTGVTYSFD